MRSRVREGFNKAVAAAEQMCPIRSQTVYLDLPMWTQRTIDTTLPITQNAMKQPMTHKNSLESAIRSIRRPK